MEIDCKYFPVGHGLTYGFSINGFNLLFDIHFKRTVYNEIQELFNGKVIDCLVLSHFHSDHVDGIKELYLNGFKIKRVYIPYIDEDEKIILSLKSHFKSGSVKIADADDIREIDDEIEVVDNTDTLVIPVKGKDFWEIQINQSESNSLMVVSKILSGLKKIGIIDKNDVLNKLKTHEKDIKSAYKKAIKHLNHTSIYMIHGPLEYRSIIESTYFGKEFYSQLIKINTANKYHSLITGDTNINHNIAEIERYASKYGFILAPHHSGVNEWSSELCKKTNDVKWIVTISKIASRPYGRVVSDIYNANHELYICDKITSFEYGFYI